MNSRAQLESAQEPLTQLERMVSVVLRAGVIASSLVMVGGIAVTLLSKSSLVAARRSIPELRRGVLHPSATHPPHSVASVLQGLGHWSGPAIVMFGLLLLIATPVLRVAVSVVAFAVERDRRFVLITLAVLVVLIGSFAVGV